MIEPLERNAAPDELVSKINELIEVTNARGIEIPPEMWVNMPTGMRVRLERMTARMNRPEPSVEE